VAANLEDAWLAEEKTPFEAADETDQANEIFRRANASCR
jgi:hypothetical protein